MKWMIAWFATNHMVANTLMGFIILVGLAALTRIPVKDYPDFESHIISVSVPYPGAAPGEVETGVCVRIEEQVEGIIGIKEVRSTAEEGLCTVRIDLFFDADMSEVLEEVKNKVNAIDTFPEETEKPIIRKLTQPNVVAEIAITGPLEERALKELGRRIRDDILDLPGVTQAAVANTRPYEISVEVSEVSLQRNKLTFDDVAAALRRRSVDLPGGSIKNDQGEVLLRIRGQAYWGGELENLAVIVRDDGDRVLLKDVAQVVDGFADTSQGLWFDGKPAALVQVGRVGNQDVRHISESVRRYVAQSASRYGEGVELTIWKDKAIELTDRLGVLVDSGMQGLLMVLILLALFLRPHLALWVAAGIPIAFLGAISLLYLFGYSIDGITLIGFVLAVGLLVDDAVVVGESVYVAHRQGAGQLAGAIEGAQQVLTPVTFGVLTTVVAFLPLLVPFGVVSQAMAITAAAVICCLVFSLIECQMVLPAHLGHRSERMPLGEFGMTFLAVVVIAAFIIAPDTRSGIALAVGAAAVVYATYLAGAIGRLGAAFARMQVRFEQGLESFVNGRFRRAAKLAFHARYMTCALAFAALASSVGIVVGGHLPFTTMLPVKDDRVVARLTMPIGVSENTTTQVVAQLAESARRVQQQLAAEYEEAPILHIMEALGGHPAAATALNSVRELSGSHLGEVIIQLTPSEERAITTDEVAEIWRNANGPATQAEELIFTTDSVEISPAIDILVSGDDLDDLRNIVAAIRAELAEYSGVYDIADTLSVGKQELKLSVRPVGEALGVTLSDLGRQVRQAFYGEEVQRIQRGRDDIRLMVRYTAAERRSLDSLYDLRVRTPSSAEVPFGAVAEVQAGRGLSVIERTGGVRSVNVTARVDPVHTSGGAILSQLDAGFLAKTVGQYAGVSYSLESLRQQEETGAGIGPLILLALFAIFALLAIPLQSHTQPLIVMMALPFALLGAVWGHALMKFFGIIVGLSMPSIAGVVAASGVVINSTLVLVHGVNRFRADGDSLEDALVNAAVTRFRPIFITTVTTFTGLLPLMLSNSVQAQPMIPMAVSLAYGILFSSVAALFVVPALWLILDDFSGGTKRVKGILGDLIGAAPRLSTWVARYPYLQESLRAQDFKNLEIPDGLGFDLETLKIARQGLVRLYYQREFGRQEMLSQLGVIAAKSPKMDVLVSEARTWAEQRTFQLGVHMTRGVIAPVDAARPLSDILDTSMAVLLSVAKEEFIAKHGGIPGGCIALVALGSLGRREFATGGPLNLLFLYDHDQAPSNAMALTPQSGQAQFLKRLMRVSGNSSPERITPRSWHEQFLKRLMWVLGNLSPDGTLYQTRPAFVLPGTDGDVAACPLPEFMERLGNSASPAELRLLTHARVIEAEGDLGIQFEDFQRSTLSKAHDLGAVAADIASIMKRLRRQHDTAGIWAVRDRPGGLAEVELAAEYLQIACANKAPEILVSGIVPTFEAAIEHRLLDAKTGKELADAATLWQNLEGFFRMTCSDAFDPKTTSFDQKQIIAEFCGLDGFHALPALIADTAKRTEEHLDNLLTGAGLRR